MNRGGLAVTNCFLIADEAAKQAVLIDAPNDTAGALMQEAKRRGWEVVALWLTHGHFDHVADHAVVTEAFPRAQVLIHALDVPKLEGKVRPTFPIPLRIPPRSPDQTIQEGDELRVGSLKARVLHTPGHSPGHVGFYFPEQGVLVGGDLIIGGAHGRTDLPDASHGDLVKSIRRVMKLPGETQLLPGHGEASTLADELRDNAYVAEMVAGA